MKYLFVLLLFKSSLVLAADPEVLSAREGAPSHISGPASVMVWKDGAYVQKVSGSNEFVCLVWADKQGTFEPSCFNEPAKKAVLPVYQFQRQMLETKMGIKEIHKKIADKAKRGEFPTPGPGAVVYMMSARNKFYDHFSRKLIRVEPHVMLYYPKIKASSLGFNSEGGLPGFYSDYPHLSVVHIHTGKIH